MLVIPAIDLRKGLCVRLAQGNPRDETVFSEQPVSIAKLWKLKKAKYIHVVDLDGAFTGSPKNLDIAFKIAKSLHVPVQFGGGVRTMDMIKKILDGGIERVIIGTKAPLLDFVKEAHEKFGDRIIVSIDARDGYVAVKGWKDVTNKKAVLLAKELKGIGLKTIIFTDVKKDGMLSGPNFKSIKEIATSSGLKVIATGGITTLRDIENVRALERYGVCGLIIGKALYTGRLDLKEAIKVGEGPLRDRKELKKARKKRKKKK